MEVSDKPDGLLEAQADDGGDDDGSQPLAAIITGSYGGAHSCGMQSLPGQRWSGASSCVDILHVETVAATNFLAAGYTYNESKRR